MEQTRTEKMSTEELYGIYKGWTLLVFVAFLIIFAFVSKFDFKSEINDLIMIYQGKFTTVSSLTIWEAFKVIINLSSMVVILSIGSLYFVPKTKSYDANKLSSIFHKGPMVFYQIIIFEELFARFLFVTVISQWLLKASPETTVILMLIGDAAWAALHYYNFKNKEDRKLLVVLPQFLAGLIFGFAYIKYGFFIALLVHLTFDFIILSTDKKQENFAPNFLNAIYWLIVFGISSWILSSHNLNTFQILGGWFTESTKLSIPTNDMWLVATLVINFSAALNFLGHFAGFDKVGEPANELEKLTFFWVVVLFLGISIATTSLILGVNWVAENFISDLALRAVIVATVVTLIRKPKSGSAMANLWFTDIPIIFIKVFVALLFPFWTTVFIFTIAGLPSYISEYIEA